MNTFTVAMLQILPTGTLEGNLQKGLKYCRKAKEMGADLAIFPEMWSNGYALSDNYADFSEDPISEDSDFVLAFRDLARELGMAIGVTYLEKFDPLPRNALRIFDRFGASVLHYAKVHTCDFGYERNLTPGEDFYTADLNTEGGMVKIGAMICYDREFPESARILMLKGAEIILVPNACPMEINRISQLRTRAFENMAGIATVNYPHGKPDCNGHSTAFDGVVYRPDVPGSRDTLILEAGEGEGIYLAAFPMDEIRRYRAEEVHGNAYRHPQKYQLLISDEIQEPFVREDYRR